MTPKAYTLANGVLTVTKDLRQDLDLSFDQACAALLAAPEKKLVIHIGRATYLGSTYVGMIAALFFQARQQGKTVAIVAKPQVLKILRAMGFEGFIEMRTPEEGAE